LCSLACQGELPSLRPIPHSMKRRHEGDPLSGSGESPLEAQPRNKVPRVAREYQFTSTPPFLNDEHPVFKFALPMHTDEPGANTQVTFTAQPHHLKTQTHPPQLDPQIIHLYPVSGSASTQGGDRSEPPLYAVPNEASSLYCRARDPQQQQDYHTHLNISQSAQTTVLTTPMSGGPYGMDAATILFGSMMGTLGHTQQYGLGPTDSSILRVRAQLANGARVFR